MSHDLYDIAGGAPGLIGQTSRKAMDSEQVSGRTLFVASTADEDRHGDIVAQDWALKQFRANPVILWMHDHSQAPIGRAVKSQTVKGDAPQLMIDVEWDKSETNPLALTVASQFESGFLSTGSVGFIPGKKTYRNQLATDHAAYKALKDGSPQWAHGMYLEKNLLLEFSATTIPANPNAQAVRSWAKEVEDPQEQMRRLLNETVEARVRELMLDYLNSDTEVQRSIVGLYLAEPAPITTPEPEPVETLEQAIARLLV